MTSRLDPLTKERRAAARRFRVAVPRWRCSICGRMDCKDMGPVHAPTDAVLSDMLKRPYVTFQYMTASGEVLS